MQAMNLKIRLLRHFLSLLYSRS